MKKELLMEMFSELVLKKNSSLISHYYHPSFVLETNGQLQDYATFAQGHERVYESTISYEVRFDPEAWVESEEKLAARLWITTRRPAEAATEIQVILIATYSGNQISHLLELTWPDWSRVKAFENYGAAAAERKDQSR